MRKDAVYRMQVPKRTLAAIKRVATARGENPSEWGRAIIDTELRRDLAALHLRASKPGGLSENKAMDLVNRAKQATRAGDHDRSRSTFAMRGGRSVATMSSRTSRSTSK